MEETYLPFVRDGRWAISRNVNGEWLSFIQGSYMNDPRDAAKALRACGLPVTRHTIDRFFPSLPLRGRSPTLEFLELFSKLGKTIKKEVGV